MRVLILAAVACLSFVSTAAARSDGNACVKCRELPMAPGALVFRRGFFPWRVDASANGLDFRRGFFPWRVDVRTSTSKR